MKLNDDLDHAIFIVNELNAAELLLDVSLDVPVQQGQVKQHSVRSALLHINKGREEGRVEVIVGD